MAEAMWPDGAVSGQNDGFAQIRVLADEGLPRLLQRTSSGSTLRKRRRLTGTAQGDDNVGEAFVIYRPTGQIMWVLLNGAVQLSDGSGSVRPSGVTDERFDVTARSGNALIN
ncbi:hypothetical protein AB9K41_14745 [Cribrihabitans sp. XS_ASV171]